MTGTRCLPSVLFLCIGPYLSLFDFLRAQRLNRGCRAVLRSPSFTRLIVEREGFLLPPQHDGSSAQPALAHYDSLASHLQRVVQLLVVLQQRVLRGSPPPPLLRQLWFCLLLADHGSAAQASPLERPQTACAAALSTKEVVRRGRYDVGIADGGGGGAVLSLLLDGSCASTCSLQPMQIQWPITLHDATSSTSTYSTRRSGRELMAARWSRVHWLIGLDDGAGRGGGGDNGGVHLDAFPRLVGLYHGALQLTSDRWSRPMLEEPWEARRKEGGVVPVGGEEQLMVIEWRAEQECAFAYCCLTCFCQLELEALTQPWLQAYTHMRGPLHRPKTMFIDNHTAEHYRKGLYIHFK